MRNDVISWMLGVAVVGGGAWWVQHSNAAVERELKRLSALASQPARDPAAALCVITMDSAVVKRELERALSGMSLSPASSAGTQIAPGAAPSGELSPEGEPAPSPDVVAAFDEAGTLIDTSLGRGTWTSDDAKHFRQLLVRLDPDGRQAMSLRLVKAMNEGKLKRTGRPEGF